MTSLILHPTTEQAMALMSKNIPRSLLISGASGTNLLEIAKSICHERGYDMFHIVPEKQKDVDTQNGTIKVEHIRQINIDVRTSTARDRVFVIEMADKMSLTAQNAFLKLLEEPNSSTRFILLTHNPRALLPTVLSRVSTLKVLPITREQSLSLIETLGVRDSAKTQQILYLAEGLVDEISRLCIDEECFGLRFNQMKQAKILVQGTAIEKLSVINSIKDNRRTIQDILDYTIDIYRMTHANTKNPEVIVAIDKLLDLKTSIQKNGNTKLQMTAHLI
jgi:DNA polymerase III subunit delta'